MRAVEVSLAVAIGPGMALLWWWPNYRLVETAGAQAAWAPWWAWLPPLAAAALGGLAAASAVAARRLARARAEGRAEIATIRAEADAAIAAARARGAAAEMNAALVTDHAARLSEERNRLLGELAGARARAKRKLSRHESEYPE